MKVFFWPVQCLFIYTLFVTDSSSEQLSILAAVVCVNKELHKSKK